MSNFSEMLGKIIRDNHISIYSLAKSIACDRTRLQKVISGERHIDMDKFVELRKELSAFVPPETLAELYERYAQDYFGSEQYRCIRTIKARITEFSAVTRFMEKNTVQKWTPALYLQRMKVTPGSREVLLQVAELLDAEWDCAVREHRKVKLYVNIPSAWKHMKGLLLCFLTQKGMRENVDFCLVAGNSCIRCREAAFENHQETSQMDNYLTHLEFASYGYNTFISHQSYYEEISEDILFPYSIVTSTACMLLSYDGELAVATHDPEKLADIAHRFLAVTEEKKRFLQKKDYEKIYLAMLSEGGERTQSLDIVGRFSVLPFCTEELLDKIIPMYCHNRNYLLRSWGDFCGLFRMQKISMFFTLESVRDFMENKETDFFGQQVGFSLTYPMKITLLKELWQYFRDTESAQLYLLKENRYALQDKFPVFCWNSRFVCSSGELYENNTKTEAVGMFCSPSVVRNLKSFHEYMIHSEACMDKESSLKVLKGLIEKMDCATSA